MPKKYILTKQPTIHLCIDCKRQMHKTLKKQERCITCHNKFIDQRKSIAQIDEEYNALLRRHRQLDDC
ncbi:MAG TPA: hypothetical protein VMW20_07320 [Candidatus Nanoarchaeia archaeon]|nr:hypothetical protein [Candidatus Nanoarchaeia archaeon]